MKQEAVVGIRNYSPTLSLFYLCYLPGHPPSSLSLSLSLSFILSTPYLFRLPSFLKHSLPPSSLRLSFFPSHLTSPLAASILLCCLHFSLCFSSNFLSSAFSPQFLPLSLSLFLSLPPTFLSYTFTPTFLPSPTLYLFLSLTFLLSSLFLSLSLSRALSLT